MFWITGLLGLALAGAPWIFNYSSESTAMWTCVIAGGIVVLASAAKGVMQDSESKNATWEYLVAALAGAVAIAAPFVLGFMVIPKRGALPTAP